MDRIAGDHESQSSERVIDEDRDRVLAEPTEGERCQSDAHLRGRYIAVEIFERPLNKARSAIAGCHPILDSASPYGNERELRRHKKGVREHEPENDRDTPRDSRGSDSRRPIGRGDHGADAGAKHANHQRRHGLGNPRQS